MMIRDLGIGGQAHKKIDAAVKQGGFEIISEPFELGKRADMAASVQRFEAASLHHIHLLATSAPCFKGPSYT